MIELVDKEIGCEECENLNNENIFFIKINGCKRWLCKECMQKIINDLQKELDKF